MAQERYHPKHFDLKQFEECSPEIMLTLSHFFLRQLAQLQGEFGSDFIMPILLGEIAHHNVARFFSSCGPVDAARLKMIMDNDGWDDLQGCNAFSLSAATGIPRETVRRKIKKLLKRGWITQKKGSGLRITGKVVEHFKADLYVRQLDHFLQTAETVQHLLQTFPAKPPELRNRHEACRPAA